MKAPLFEYPSYQYQIDDWDFKKKGLLKRIKSQKFIRSGYCSNFETDRLTNNKTYLHYFEDLIRNELNEFCSECKVSCTMTDCWTVIYKIGDYQNVHNHRSWGFSGVLYVEYDPKVHTPTCFVSPWQDPRTDTTILTYPQSVQEGTLLIVPSNCLHYVNPNKSKKIRTIVAFDLLPELPNHQKIKPFINT